LLSQLFPKLVSKLFYFYSSKKRADSIESTPFR